MTAIAMQQAAAAAAAGHPFLVQGGMQLLPAMVNQLQGAQQASEAKPVTTEVVKEQAAAIAPDTEVTTAAITNTTTNDQTATPITEATVTEAIPEKPEAASTVPEGIVAPDAAPDAASDAVAAPAEAEGTVPAVE